jgi:hypothetical protein
MGCIYLGLSHFLIPALVFTLSVSYKVSIQLLCVNSGNIYFTTYTARGPTLGKFHWGLFRHSWDCKGFETSTGHGTVRTLQRNMVFIIWVNILAIFGHEAKA